MLAENNMRQGFLEHGDFVSSLATCPIISNRWWNFFIEAVGAEARLSSSNGAT